MYKILEKNLGIFVISNWTDSDGIEFYEENNYSNPIKIYFHTIPNLKMTENQFIEYSNDFNDELKMEVDNLINENDKFYKNFDISFNGKFTSFSYDRNSYVSSATMYVDCELKVL